MAAELVRCKEWASTPLGPVERWPQLLFDTVNLVLSAPLPMQVYWGPQFVSIYNDGLIPALADKHPAALGRPAADTYKEAWSLLGVQFDRVRRNRLAEMYQRQAISLLRNGVLEEMFWDYSFTPLFAEDGSVAGLLNVAQDVTELVLNVRKRLAAEREKEHTLTQLDRVLETTADAVFNLDRDWVFTYLNGNARRLLGSYGELVGRNLWEAFPHTQYEGSPFIREYSRSMHEGLPGEFETFYPKPEGWFQVLSRPAAEGITVFFRDVTASKQASEALIRTEKLAAVGRLAASIAHEVNNPLESVTNLLYLARISVSMSEIQEYLDMAERELRRVSVITNQTLRFYKQSSSPRAVGCDDLFESVLSIYQGRLLNSKIKVEERKRAKRLIQCFDGEIRQVLTNLVGNAIDAMHPHGGRLIVRSREACDWRTGQKGIALTVADTGPGMSSDVSKRMFEAFYSTKGIGGTGLGLWVSKEIVDRHDGTLLVRTSQKETHSGTVFTLFLPFDAVCR